MSIDKNNPLDKNLPDGTIIHRDQTAVVDFIDDDGINVKTEEYGLFEAAAVRQLVGPHKFRIYLWEQDEVDPVWSVGYERHTEPISMDEFGRPV